MATPKTITATYIGTYDPSAANCPAYIVLERSFPGEPTRVFKSPYSGSPVVFQDLSAVSGKDYHYLAYAVNRDGVKGENTSDGYKPSFLHQTTTPSPFSYGQLSNAGIQPQISSTATGVLTGDGALDNIDTSFTAGASASGTLVGTGSLAGGSAGAGSSTGVVVQPPAAPVRLQPNNAQWPSITSVPTFTFTAISNAVDYQIILYDPATAIYTRGPWYSAAACGVPSGTGTGSVTWWGTPLNTAYYLWSVCARNGAQAQGPNGSYLPFYVNAPAPPARLTPSGGQTISGSIPTLTFTAVTGATDYQVIIFEVATRTYTRGSWISAAAAGVPDGTGTGSITWGSSLTTGAWMWSICARTGTSQGTNGTYLTFYVT